MFTPLFIQSGLGLLNSAFRFSQGGIEAIPLNSGPSMEFGAKAHNLGRLYGSSMARITSPGVAVLQSPESAYTDKMDAMNQVVSWLERHGKGRFGASSGSPLLLAVRSSPVTSAPGIAKSILYVGLNDQTVKALAEATSPAVAHRTHAWFLKSWGAGIPVPEDPYEQLLQAADRVARSMMDAGMSGGLIVQKAVVIDDDPLSGSGVYFTRSIKDGTLPGSARFARGGAGSEVVTGDAGIELVAQSPILAGLDTIRHPLEKLYADAVECEFAAVRGALVLLQARPLAFPDPEVQVSVWASMVKGGLLAAGDYPKRIFDLRNNVPAGVKVVDDPKLLKNPVGVGGGINKLYAAQGRLIDSVTTASQNDSDALPILYTENPNEPAVLNAVWSKKIAGIVTSNGHDYSHLAILARVLKIPMLIGFKDDVAVLIDSEVLLDEVTGALYKIEKGEDSLLIAAPQTDAGHYLGVDMDALQAEALKAITGRSIKAISNLHNSWVMESIQLVKKKDFESAARMTFKAHFLHIELGKLENRKDPFVVYEWEKERLPDAFVEKYGGKYPEGINTALVSEAFNIDPMFRVLSNHYGDRLRIEAKVNVQAGQYRGRIDFYRISAVVEGGSPFLMRREFNTSDTQSLVISVMRGLFHIDPTPKPIIAARAEAQTLAEKIPGARVVEYDVVDNYHDRGLLSGTKVIGVLPPLRT